MYVPGSGTNDKVDKTISCVSESSTPVTVWTNSSHLTRIEVKWDADVSITSPLPRVDYISNSPVPIGVVDSYFTVDVNDDCKLIARRFVRIKQYSWMISAIPRPVATATELCATTSRSCVRQAAVPLDHRKIGENMSYSKSSGNVFVAHVGNLVKYRSFPNTPRFWLPL